LVADISRISEKTLVGDIICLLLTLKQLCLSLSPAMNGRGMTPFIQKIRLTVDHKQEN